MKESCDAIQALISGYLDEELDESERAQLKAHLEQCPSCQNEFDEMKKLVQATASLRIENPPEEVWDTFLDNVYNRMERKLGWLVFIAGAALLVGWGIYVFATEPGMSALAKMAVAAPVIGLGVVFVSVLRQRLWVAKTDRYSREIHR